jgi:mono/diheme cytochrome c family protein
MADLAAAMWNHAPKMEQKQPELNEAEMRSLVGYLWSIQYFEPPGDAGKGEGVFARKHCGHCHGEGGSAPPVASAARPLNPILVVAALWRHGPQMQAQMLASKLGWPRFRGQEMADLIAFVNGQ